MSSWKTSANTQPPLTGEKTSRIEPELAAPSEASEDEEPFSPDAFPPNPGLEPFPGFTEEVEGLEASATPEYVEDPHAELSQYTSKLEPLEYPVSAPKDLDSDPYPEFGLADPSGDSPYPIRRRRTAESFPSSMSPPESAPSPDTFSYTTPQRPAPPPPSEPNFPSALPPDFGPHARLPASLFSGSAEQAGIRGKHPHSGQSLGLLAGRGSLVLTLVGILAFGLIIVAWAGNKRRLEAQSQWPELPQIAETEPYRVPAENPDTPVNPYTDTQVYDQLDSADQRNREPPNIVMTPTPAAPVLPAPTQLSARGRLPSHPSLKPANPANQVAAIKAQTEPDSGTGPIFSDGLAANVPAIREEAPSTAAKATTTEVESQTTNPVPSASNAAQNTALAGQYVVQLFSARSLEDAEWEWTRITRSDTSLFSDVSKIIQKVSLGDKGVFYRLRVGPFASSGEARVFCERYRRQGGKCWWLRNG